MNVKELREYLDEFQDDANVQVVVNNSPTSFSIAWGGADGGTKATAHNVSFMVDGTNDESNQRQ